MDIRVRGHAGAITVTVSNAGPDLDDDALRVMFDPLRRGSRSASQGEHASLGLGLFLVREITRAHGGSVEAASSDGTTTFSITLPRNT